MIHDGCISGLITTRKEIPPKTNALGNRMDTCRDPDFFNLLETHVYRIHTKHVSIYFF